MHEWTLVHMNAVVHDLTIISKYSVIITIIGIWTNYIANIIDEALNYCIIS